MRQFIAVVDKDPDSSFGVWFPDVQGCFSAADKEKDIIPNAIESLILHLDGLDIPLARDIVTISHEVKDDLARGAFLMSIPLVTMAHKQVRANISMDKGMLDAIDIAAAERKLTRSAFIAEASMNEIERRW